MMRSAAIIAVGLASALVVSSIAEGAAAPAVCFTANDNRRLEFPVIQQAPPPHGADRRYRYYPLTAAASMQMPSLRGAPDGIDTYFFHWANRSTAPIDDGHGRSYSRKANIQPSSLGLRRERTGFGTVGRADACTLAQLAVLLDRSGEAQAIAAAGGIGLVNEIARPDTSPSDGFKTGPADQCVVPATPLPRDIGGILLDFEVADGRTAQQARALLLRYAAMVHVGGRSAILLIDPFNAPSQRLSGIGQDNASAIVNAFDKTTLMLWGGNVERSISASYRTQRAIIDAGGKVAPGRLIIDFDLAGTSLDDAAFVGEVIRRDRLGGVTFWRNRSGQGGDCGSEVNRKIATILFATSAGAVGPERNKVSRQDNGEAMGHGIAQSAY